MTDEQKQLRVLVVDDDPFALRLLRRQLANLGFTQVVLCESGQDALAVLENGSGPIDLILCDLQMPQMDGVELLRSLVSIGYAGGLVLVSGEDERVLQSAQRLAQAHRLNVYGALHKPVSPERLRQLLELDCMRSIRAPRIARNTYAPEELRRALSNGELENHYKPKVEIASGMLTGVETLVRWCHPRDGLVLPDQFIATAEDCGLIDELARAVLTGALRQARLWQDAGLQLHVAVNVSMDNLAALEFPDFVMRAARDAGVSLARVVLEVTESRLMKDIVAPLDILTRLRLKGVGLSIDDFGTGHSSLAQLRDIPFDELKVDRGFVHGAWRDASLRTICRASLDMARRLRIKTVGEGVEDRADWDFLRAAGCDMAQGYFIGRPMPAADLASWMAGWTVRPESRTGAAS